MVDTTTPLLGLLLMGTGGDDNAWGANLNTQVITLIENAIAGVTSLSISGGSHSLSATESRSATIILTGTLTSNQVLIVPTTAKNWTFINQCVLGGFEVQVQTSGGVLRNLPGGSTDITSDGSGTLYRKEGHLVGELFYHAGTTAPSHSLACNGATASRTLYGDLYAKISTTWGVGDGVTTFTLPNGADTNRFLRAAGGSLNVGTYQANQNLAHTHVATASAVTGTTDSQGAHIHSITDPGHSHTTPAQVLTEGAGGAAPPISSSGNGFNANNPTTTNTTGISINSAGAHTHNVTGTAAAQAIASQGGTEARPESLVGLLCIRY